LVPCAGRGVPPDARPGATVAFVADKFPSDFYVTCATVIPVLFIASVLQARQLQAPLAAGYRAYKRVLSGGKFSDRMTYAVLLFVPAIVVTAGGVGEIFALLALYSGSELLTGQRPVTLASTVILLVAVVYGSAFSALKAGIEAVRKASGGGEAAQD